MSLKGSKLVDLAVNSTERAYKAKEEFDEGFLRSLVALAYAQFINNTKDWVMRYESPRDDYQGELHSEIHLNIVNFEEKTDFLNCVNVVCYKDREFKEELSAKNLLFGTLKLAFSAEVFYTKYSDLVAWGKKIKSHYKISDELYNLMTNKWTNVEYMFPNKVDVNKLNYRTCLFFDYNKFDVDKNTLDAPVNNPMHYAIDTRGLDEHSDRALVHWPYKDIKFLKDSIILQFDLRINKDTYDPKIVYNLCVRNSLIDIDRRRISYIRPIDGESVEEFYARTERLLQDVYDSYKILSLFGPESLFDMPENGAVIGIIYSRTQNIKPTVRIAGLMEKLKKERQTFVAINLDDFDVYVRKLEDNTLLELLYADISIYKEKYAILDAEEAKNKALENSAPVQKTFNGTTNGLAGNVITYDDVVDYFKKHPEDIDKMIERLTKLKYLKI